MIATPHGSKDGKDYIAVEENGKIVVYKGASIDGTNSVEEHHQKIIDDGVVATDEELQAFGIH